MASSTTRYGGAGGALPLLGHLVPMLRDPLAFLMSLPARGDLVEIRIGPARALMVCDPELVRRLLHEDDVFDKGGPMWERGREVIGKSPLAACPHSAHREQRRLVQPAFHRDRFPGYAQAMTERINAITGRWHDGQILDVPAETLKITSSATVRTMFSGTVSPDTADQTRDDLAAIFSALYLRMLLPPAMNRLPTPGNRRYNQARARLRHTTGQIIAERIADPESLDRDDLLSALLAARNAGSRTKLTETELGDEVISFFIGGMETAAVTIAWALDLIARNPEIERRLHAEVDSVLEGNAPSLEHLPRLETTSRIITETLRLYPPAWILSRITTAPVVLGGHRIPASTSIFFSPYMLHHRGDLFPDPERFDPDRWNGVRTPPPRGSFIPFSLGPRKCIGDQFAMTMASLSVASIATRWRLTSITSCPPRPAAALTLRPRGLRMRVLERSPRNP